MKRVICWLRGYHKPITKIELDDDGRVWAWPECVTCGERL